MGNAITQCCMATGQSLSIKLIFWEGHTKTLTGKPRLAGEIMFEFPDRMVCDTSRFFIGQPIPALSIADRLTPGRTYLVLPLDIFSSKILSASAISALVACRPNPNPTAPTPVNIKECPFEYINGSNGRVLIKVAPDFISRLFLTIRDVDDDGIISSNGKLCSTPELKKQYEQLVGSKDQIWSPKLDTILEHQNNFRYSPCTNFIRL